MNFQARMILPILFAAAVSAQEADPPPTQKKQSPQPPVVTMTFRGGTLADFVDAVRKAEPKANIVVAKEAASAHVPWMEVKMAGLDQVLESACAVASSDDRIRCSQSRGNGEPVFAIIAQPVQAVSHLGSTRNEIGTIVLSLNRLTEGDASQGVAGLRIETILSAIEASCHFEEKAPMLRYHEDSGLLFLRGNHGQLSLASEVLSILERDQKERAKIASVLRREQAKSGANAGGAESKDR